MITLKPIGAVKSDFKNPKDLHFACEKGRLAETQSRIVIGKEFCRGLKGLEKFSNLWVLYHLHKAGRTEMVTHPGPPDIKNLPRVGIFASRSQYRPNHLALRLVDLVKISGNEITVKSLDAIDGSPVLDIKPYIPHFDKTESERIAEWYKWTENNMRG